MMHNVMYLVGLLLVGLFFLWFAIKPLSVSRWYQCAIFSVVVVIVGVGYSQWGGMAQLVRYQTEQSRAEQAKILMQQLKTPQALIQRLKETIRHAPHPDHGWYLLGRVYASQGKWHAAMRAFAQAMALKPTVARYQVNYVDAEWNAGNRFFSSKIHQDLAHIVQQFPNQPDALVMLATEAYQNQQYLDAIQYWQKLLTLTPANSEAASALRRAIAQAEQQQKIVLR